MKPEFEEKTFEVAANNEFSLLGAGVPCPGCGASHCVLCGQGHPSPAIDVWAPGQVLEGRLGFDVAIEIDGDSPDLQNLLNTAIPPGMNWKPHYGDPVGLGSAPSWASLFLQYKRADRLVRRRGQFLTMFDGPYYRYDLDPDQHTKLATFRDAAAGQALVLYASPQFHTNEDMHHYRRNKLVLERTAFIEATDPGQHEYGAYDETVACLCSDPRPVPLLSLQGLVSAIRRLDPDRDPSDRPLRDHISNLALAVRQTEAGDRIDQPPITLAQEVLTVSRFALGHELRWLVVEVRR